MISVRKQDKTFRGFATIMAALVVLASSAASQRADSSRAASSRSTSHAAKNSSDPKALSSSDPSPVNLLAIGQYQTNYHSRSTVSDVAVGDFNKHGYQDVVVVDQTTCVTFMPGNAQGQLGAPVDSCVLPTTGGQFVVAGDFNNDGILDLAVITSGVDATVWLAQGKGNGTLTGADAGNFKPTNHCPSLLAPSDSCTIEVTFAPSTTGSRRITLRVTDNLSTSPHDVPLVGKGN